MAIDNETNELLRRAKAGDKSARDEIRERYFDEASRICQHFAKRKGRNGARGIRFEYPQGTVYDVIDRAIDSYNFDLADKPLAPGRKRGFAFSSFWPTTQQES